MIVKSYEIQKKISTFLKYNFFLLYGENFGLKKDIKELIKMALKQIDNNIEKINWNLLEENLFLGNKWRVKAVPTLLVKSNDVKASHSCKMERISDEKLFYLRSRWIWRQNALVMMIEAKIKSLFSCLFMFDNTFYKELVEKILKKVQ